MTTKEINKIIHDIKQRRGMINEDDFEEDGGPWGFNHGKANGKRKKGEKSKEGQFQDELKGKQTSDRTENFLKELRKTSPKHAKIARAIANGISPEEYARKTGTSMFEARQRYRDTKKFLRSDPKWKKMLMEKSEEPEEDYSDPRAEYVIGPEDEELLHTARSGFYCYDPEVDYSDIDHDTQVSKYPDQYDLVPEHHKRSYPEWSKEEYEDPDLDDDRRETRNALADTIDKQKINRMANSGNFNMGRAMNIVGNIQRRHRK